MLSVAGYKKKVKFIIVLKKQKNTKNWLNYFIRVLLLRLCLSNVFSKNVQLKLNWPQDTFPRCHIMTSCVTLVPHKYPVAEVFHVTERWAYSCRPSECFRPLSSLPQVLWKQVLWTGGITRVLYTGQKLGRHVIFLFFLL